MTLAKTCILSEKLVLLYQWNKPSVLDPGLQGPPVAFTSNPDIMHSLNPNARCLFCTLQGVWQFIHEDFFLQAGHDTACGRHWVKRFHVFIYCFLHQLLGNLKILLSVPFYQCGCLGGHFQYECLVLYYHAIFCSIIPQKCFERQKHQCMYIYHPNPLVQKPLVNVLIK